MPLTVEDGRLSHRRRPPSPVGKQLSCLVACAGLGFSAMLSLSHSCCKEPQLFAKLDLGGIISLLCLK